MEGEVTSEKASLAAVPWHSRTLRVVLISTLLAPLGVPLVSPALPVIRDAFGVTDAQASLLVSAYFVTGIFLSPFIGMLADRIGRRRVLLPSLLVFGLTGGTMAFAPDFTTIVALRIVQGTAAAGIFITTVTLIGDVFDGVERNRILGINIAVLSVGAAAFPIVGGSLAAVAWNAPFLAYFAALPVALYAGWVLEEPTRDANARGLSYLRGAAEAISRSHVVVFYGAAFLTELLLFGSILTAMPFLLTETYGLAPVAIGLIITVAEVAAAVVSTQNGRFARRFSNDQLVSLGLGCIGLGLLVIWLAPSPVVVGVGAIVIGAGLGLSMPAVDAAISGTVAAQYRGGALSLRNSATFLGRATGPVSFAGIAVVTGYEALLLASGAVALASGLAVLETHRRNRDRVRKPRPEHGERP